MNVNVLEMKLIEIIDELPDEAIGKFMCVRCNKVKAIFECLVEMFNPTRRMTAQLCHLCVIVIPKSSQSAIPKVDHESAVIVKPKAKDLYTKDGWDL